MFYRKHLWGLFMLLALPLFLFSSCQSEEESTSEAEGQCTITFTVSNYRQISFDDLSSSASTRAVPSDHPATLAHLLIAFYNAETGQQACLIQHDQKDYENQDDAYPKFSVTLPYGRYHVIVLGFNGSQGCKITSVNNISWNNDYVPNTFLYYDDLTLDKNTNLDQKLTLRRVVTAFRLTAEDAIPAGLKKMRFISTVGGTVLDAATGYASQNTGRTGDMFVPADSVGKQGVCFTSYLFLSDEQAQSNYVIQALGQNDKVLYEKRFNDVPLRINVLTEWKGKFFEASSDEGEYKTGFSLYWDTQWADTITIAQ